MPHLRRQIAPSIARTKQLPTLSQALFIPQVTIPWVERDFLEVCEDASGLRLVLSLEALASYVPRPDERVAPLAAAWLHEARCRVETDQVVTSAAWCAACGSFCRDQRVARGYVVARVRQWCDRCRKRFRSEFRACAAADCLESFWTTRRNHLFCCDACERAEVRRTASSLVR